MVKIRVFNVCSSVSGAQDKSIVSGGLSKTHSNQSNVAVESGFDVGRCSTDKGENFFEFDEHELCPRTRLPAQP